MKVKPKILLLTYILSCVFRQEERGSKLQKPSKSMVESDEFDREWNVFDRRLWLDRVLDYEEASLKVQTRGKHAVHVEEV